VSTAITGAWIGAGLGLLSFAVLRHVAAGLEREGNAPDKRRAAAIIRFAALFELMLFPILGYVIGPMLLDA
jgi:uncharacterized Tic20 family protein